MRVDVDFTINQGGIQQLFSWGGEIGVYLERIANMTADKSKSIAPVRSGALRDSIHPEKSAGVTSIGMDVTASVDYAYPVHEGSEPHTITPKNSEFLYFAPKNGPKLIRVKSVNHPGSKPNPYLWNALVDVVTRGDLV